MADFLDANRLFVAKEYSRAMDLYMGLAEKWPYERLYACAEECGRRLQAVDNLLPIAFVPVDPRIYILRQIHETCRQMDLDDLYGCPSWSDGKFFRECTQRLERGDFSAWREFLQHIAADHPLKIAVRSMLVDRFIAMEVTDKDDVQLSLPPGVITFTKADKKEFIKHLNRPDRERVLIAERGASLKYAEMRDSQTFIPPSNESSGEIMYIEMKPGLAGPAYIGRVQFSKTRKTIYYRGRTLQSLKGSGYKANYYNVESAMWYWISKCKKAGNDSLYPGIIEIDDDVREEYWIELRNQPKNKHLTKFRSLGKYSKHRPR